MGPPAPSIIYQKFGAPGHGTAGQDNYKALFLSEEFVSFQSSIESHEGEKLS